MYPQGLSLYIRIGILRRDIPQDENGCAPKTTLAIEPPNAENPIGIN